MSKDDEKRPDDDVKSRRELLSATAKLSAFLGLMGIAGAGLTGEAAAEARTLKRTAPMHKVRPRGKRLLPAVQKRELKGLLHDAMRSGNTQLALKRHPNLKLSPRQKAALSRMTRQDWAALRRMQAKLGALESLAAGDTGVIFW